MSTEDIKSLRDITGLSFNEIRKALEEAGGNHAKALELLKSRGAVLAEKKSSRSTGEGIVASYIHSTKKIGVLVELLCETDFVARNPDFGELSHEIALHIAASSPETVEELLAQPFIKDPSITVHNLLTNSIAKIGENIKIARFSRFQI